MKNLGNTLVCVVDSLKNTVGCFMLFFSTFLNGVVINCELASLPQKLCCVWSATRDFKQRKFNYSLNNCYVVNLQINNKASHVVLLILLAGDAVTNPGPWSSPPSNQTVKCLSVNARSLTSLHRPNNSDESWSNMEHLQKLVYSEDSDIVCVNETRLNDGICDLEILHSGYTIFRNDRNSRGGGVLLAVKTSSFKSLREVL